MLSKFDVIAPILAVLVGTGMALHLSGKFTAQILTQALPEAAADVVTGAAPAAPTGHPNAHIAVFAGGCFWGVQSVFQHTQGVVSAVSGYAGGLAAYANYTDVSTGSTGHAEAVEVTYDPSIVSYAQLLRVYFSVAHDPTQRDAQYPDTGPQYRSTVFYTDAYQQQVAQRYIAQIEAAKAFSRPVVTSLEPLVDHGFHPAETLHQNYTTRYPGNAYVAQFSAPKLVKFKELLPALYRDVPILAH